MNIDVEKLQELLRKDNSVSFGSFDLDGKPAVGVLFCLPEHFPAVEKFTAQLIEDLKTNQKK